MSLCDNPDLHMNIARNLMQKMSLSDLGNRLPRLLGSSFGLQTLALFRVAITQVKQMPAVLVSGRWFGAFSLTMLKCDPATQLGWASGTL